MSPELPLQIFIALALVPLLPLLAAGVIALLKAPRRQLAAGLAIGAQAGALLATAVAFFWILGKNVAVEGEVFRAYWNFSWMSTGAESVRLGLLLDPLNAGMLLMVTSVSLLIFIYSASYMKEDANFTRFFCFLSLFSAGMLGLVAANSLLLLFIAWEIVGLASFLLIGFWFHKPSAAAAARKAFIVTRIGDLGLFLGMLWLFSETGTLLFYDGGAGILEESAVSALAAATVGGMAVSTAIALLLFCGAAGKSGQLPLHVWLPDAMEGPTPVSALIHAATMVAAGVFLVARAFPIFAASTDPDGVATALIVVAWIGAATALFAALLAVAQTDLKRILAYSTVSQLGFMMLALGAGSVAAAMFHLIAHAYFKALLFLGAGSTIHACGEEQDIRKMGGLWNKIPGTFIPYAIGMMALAGVPFLFSGFWSKEGILHAAHEWEVARGPFFIALAATFLTAFYMTRQVARVFFGNYRGKGTPHESPRAMLVPLWILAAAAILLSLIATPAWPWYNHFLTGDPIVLDLSMLFYGIGLIATSILLVGAGIGIGWWLYGRGAARDSEEDPLELRQPAVYRALGSRLWVDELYEATVIRWFRGLGKVSAWCERALWGRAVDGLGGLGRAGSRMGAAIEGGVVNRAADRFAGTVRQFGKGFSLAHTGRPQAYMRFIALGAVALLVLYAWLA